MATTPTSDYKMIPCRHYDYLELACLRGYQLHLDMLDGKPLQAQAITTETHADKSEWLIVQSDGKQQAVRLDRIIAMTPLTPRAEFGRVLIAAE